MSKIQNLSKTVKVLKMFINQALSLLWTVESNTQHRNSKKL